jgi:hypothetical protein
MNQTKEKQKVQQSNNKLATNKTATESLNVKQKG